SQVTTYDQLVEVAAKAGYGVTPSQVHRAVKARLVRTVAERGGVGHQNFHASLSEDMVAQFLAWCRLRLHTTRVDQLRILMWLERWPVPLGDVRRSLAAWLPTTDSMRLTDSVRHKISRMAFRHRKEFRRDVGPYKLTDMDAADAAEYVVLRALGDTPVMHDELRALLAKTLGLERARVDTRGDASPWYSGDAAPESLFEGFSLDEMRDLLTSATDEDLEWARSRAHFLLWGFAPAISRLEEAAGKGFAGLHGAARLSPSQAALAVIVVLHARNAGFSQNIDEMAEVLGAAG
ncbi:MAG: hypothetical protein M3406_10460, partial [Chloroflexota bacterium]|nr:hypothetical protein [Chloroflexota bacterium]